MRKVFDYIILAIIQGLTEPIPVSSSGHMVIVKHLLKMSVLNDLNFEIVANFGSFIAILFFYRKKIFALIKSFFNYIKTKENKYYDEYKYCWLIVVGCIPAGICGLLFKDKIESLSSNVKIVGIALLVTAVLLFIVKNRKGSKKDKGITLIDSIKIGLFQVLALLPGISRSGSTIVGGLLCDLKTEVAFDYSFMLYIPISCGTMILGIKDMIESGNLSSLWLPYLLGMIVSGVLTYFSIKLVSKIVKENKLIYFVFYCLILGTLTLLFLK